MTPVLLLVPPALFLVLVGVVVALVVRSRNRASTPAASGGRARPAEPTARLGAEGWQAAGPSLEALGLTKLTAESYWNNQFDGPFVSLEVREASVSGRLERTCPGGVLELYLGTATMLRPGDQGKSDLERFVTGTVGEVLGALPRHAELTVRAPEIPGGKCLLLLTTPFSSPDQPALVARVLLMLAEAARSPAPAGAARAAIPPAAARWLEAGAGLEALGLTKLDAETHWSNPHGLFVSLDVRHETVTGRLRRPAPGGVLERFLGAEAALRPGERASSEVDRFVAGEVGEVLSALPKGARLTVKAPEMPGDEAKLLLTTPFSAPDQPAIVARVLLMVDEAARRPAPAGAPHAQMPPAAMRWVEAGPSLDALGLTKLDAESYWNNGRGLFVSVDVREGTVTGRLKAACPGGVLEGFLRAEVVLRPGERGGSELERFVAGQVGEVLGGLPREARLTVTAPEIPGDTHRVLLTTPFSAPGQAATVAQVLLMLDDAARRSR